MQRVGVKKARESMSALLDRVAAGEEVALLRRGSEIARLVPPRARSQRLPMLETFRASLTVRGQPMSVEVVRGRRRGRY